MDLYSRFTPSIGRLGQSYYDYPNPGELVLIELPGENKLVLELETKLPLVSLNMFVGVSLCCPGLITETKA